MSVVGLINIFLKASFPKIVVVRSIFSDRADRQVPDGISVNSSWALGSITEVGSVIYLSNIFAIKRLSGDSVRLKSEFVIIKVKEIAKNILQLILIMLSRKN